MKRRQRRPVLDINGEQSDSPRRRWQNKYEQIAADHSEQNGGPSNPLSNLLEQYNSDSETDDSKPEAKQLDDKVNDFLKEIQLIAPEPPAVDGIGRKVNSNTKEPQENSTRVPSGEPSTPWQECFDDSTGYPYYWHVETNEVTWEVPEEIRLLRERNQQDSLNRTSYSTQWVNFSSNTYPQPQINIPEGMIPKEVVARNRNRQVSLQQNSPQGSQSEQNSSKSLAAKDDESDDGKIEMITSFRSDGSESETSDNDSPSKKVPKESQVTEIQSKVRIGQEPSKNSSVSLKKADDKAGKIGPLLPSGIVPLIHGPENSSKNDTGREKWRRKPEEEKALKGQQSPKRTQKLETSSGTKDSMETSTSHGSQKLTVQSKGKFEEEPEITNPGKELKFSLVPGYADDSDAEDDATPKKANVEPLFPITDFSTNSAATIVSQDGTVKKVETKYTDSGSVRIFQYHTSTTEKTENLEKEVNKMNQELEVNVQESAEVDETRVVRVEEETPKPNIFLENLETPSKAFQRKRRIAFDVIPTKSRSSEVEHATVTKLEPVPSPPAVFLGNETDRHGLGFPKEAGSFETEDSPDTLDRKTNSPILEKPTSTSKAPISFVKGETMVAKTDDTVKEKSEEEINELKKVTETIMEKLKFLSEGGQPASAVQVMAIQLQTLLAAWEARDLKDNYLENWLTGTGRELGRLEEAAAPPGWDCQWDRSHKRYFYRNSTTGDAQWTYPEADVIGGTEEMELCTTPPPQGQEEPCIIESQPEKFEEVPSTLMEKERPYDESSESKKLNCETSKEVTIPPPPQISSPSPPPPPKIYAEDMKKSKKRRGSIHGTIPDIKRDKPGTETNGDDAVSTETVNPPLPPSPTKSAQPPLPPHPPIVPNPPNSEPLPPGVDPPDMPFTINAPSIETTMLYTPTGPQANPIYAATIGDPTILGHHTALMQGQLMHYPTYHQHLHNQAIIAAANRLSGQDAVQFMVDYSQVYANTQVIAKPPIKSHKESLGSAIDSFYSDIASIEKIRNDHETEQILPIEPSPVTIPQIIQEVEPPILTDSVLKERKKKKTKLGISKKQKEVSSMVAKWQKAQHYEDND